MIAVPSLHVAMTVDTSCIPLGRWGLACRGSASAQATLLYVLASERHNAWNLEVGTGAMSLKLDLQTAVGRANCCTVCIGSQRAESRLINRHIGYATAAETSVYMKGCRAVVTTLLESTWTVAITAAATLEKWI